MSFNLAPIDDFGRVKNPCDDCFLDDHGHHHCSMNCSGRIVDDTPEAIYALDRLIRIAKGSTGQSARVANFLLAWWNATRDGGFDLTDLWNVDKAIADDMVTVFAFVAQSWNYPDGFGYGPSFEELVTLWRSKRRRTKRK